MNNEGLINLSFIHYIVSQILDVVQRALAATGPRWSPSTSVIAKYSD